MSTDSLRTSLRCLVHPATIFSIVLLLLNDHLFKLVAPCWITGKVSDFAGLFFFPFLLAAMISVFLTPLHRPTPMIIGRIAFAVTATWFTAAKATPLGHALTTQVVSAMLGHEVLVTLDPTDLIGLVILWPAWRLWSRQAVKADRRFSIRAGWLVLALAAIATVATTCPLREKVLRVVVADGEMYALTSYYGPGWWVYKTSDDGRSWSSVHPIPESLKNVYFPPEQVVVADPHNPLMLHRVSYRTPHKERVEYSHDGGSTWRIAWQVPAARREFMDIYVGKGRMVICVGAIDMGPYDLALTPDGSGTLVVAMGTEGVLVRDPSGTWSRYAVGSASPTPFRTLNPGKVLDILLLPEGVVLFSSVLLVPVVFSIAGWVPMLRAVRRVHGGRKVVWVMRPLLAWMVVHPLVMAGDYAILTAADYFRTPLLFRSLYTLFIVLVLLWPVMLVLLLLETWSRAISLASDTESAVRSRKGCVWATVGLFLAGWLPFFLWAAGIVLWYNQALVSAIILGVAVVLVGAIKVYRHSHAAVRQDEQRGTASNPP